MERLERVLLELGPMRRIRFERDGQGQIKMCSRDEFDLGKGLRFGKCFYLDAIPMAFQYETPTFITRPHFSTYFHPTHLDGHTVNTQKMLYPNLASLNDVCTQKLNLSQ